MSYLCPQCNSFLMEDYIWWVPRREKAHNLVVCDVWRGIRLEATEQAFGRAVLIRPRYSKHMQYLRAFA